VGDGHQDSESTNCGYTPSQIGGCLFFFSLSPLLTGFVLSDTAETTRTNNTHSHVVIIKTPFFQKEKEQNSQNIIIIKQVLDTFNQIIF